MWYRIEVNKTSKTIANLFSISTRPCHHHTMDVTTQFVLEETGQRIRQIDKRILSIERERAAILSRPQSSRPGTSATDASDAQPLKRPADTSSETIIELQTERDILCEKYERLNNGDKYKPTLEVQLFDFFEAYYNELQRLTKDYNWLCKYYHPNIHLNIVGLGSFEDRDCVVRTLMVSSTLCVTTVHY
jgi:hypothetical protein